MKSFSYLCFILCFSVLVTYPACADVVKFSFYQEGFGEGASVSGTFTGEDLNGNAELSSGDGEIIDFTMAFSGNSLVSAFMLNVSELNGLSYNFDGGMLGDAPDLEGIAAGNGIFDYVAGPGPFGQCGIGLTCALIQGERLIFSSELIQVTAVPVPAAFWLFASGIVGLVGISERKQHNHFNMNKERFPIVGEQ